jgi:phosphatidylserine decarboxylase
MSIAKEGYTLILTAAVLMLVAFFVGWKLTGVFLGVVTLAIAGFFRDPTRNVPVGEGLIVAPADGRVVNIAAVQEEDALFAGAVMRVSIFLSPLDVHINRAPVGGRIEEVRYKAGRFLAAYKQESSRINEQNALKIVDPQGRALSVVQIAGIMARRIVCRVKRGDS